MSESLIAQVRALANCNAYDYQGGHYDADGRRIPIPNWSALLAHLERTQAVVDSARSVLVALGVDDVPYTGIKRALENLETNDGK